MRRIVAGCVAALVALATGGALAYVEIRLFHRIKMWSIWPVALAAGGAVLVAADKLGLLGEVYRHPTRLGFDDRRRQRKAGPVR
jgi:hypothetical protein